MKKIHYFLGLAMSLVMAASISSCEDVPAPYQLFLEEGGGTAANDSLGKYRETPYSVAAAIKAQGSGKTGNVWVKGYIVGYIPTGGETSTTINNTVFAAPTDDMKSNIVLAPSADEQIATNCMAIQLPVGVVRDALNLKDNPTMLGASVMLYGSLEKYFGGAGLKSVSYAQYGENKAGKDPDSVQTKFEHISIKEFLEKKDTQKGYEITGVATGLNTNYASFDLTEDGSKIYIYRMNNKDGNKADLTALGIEEGDTITVTGVYLAYTDKNGNVKDEINPATYVSHKKGKKQTVFEHISIAEFLSRKHQDVAYEITGVATGLNENYASFDLTQGDATVYVYKTVDDKGTKVSLSALGIAEGDSVTVRGKYYPYVKDGVTKDEIQTATFVSVKKGSGGEVPPVGESITLDFSTNTWGLPEGTASGLAESKEFTSGDYTITLAAPDKYYYNATSKVLMLGKKGATLTFPAFDFAVARIDVVGAEKASAAVIQNIYVGEVAVSTSTTGAQSTNTYEIAADYQAAGNQYTLKVESAHNTQISKIVIYKAVADNE